VRLHLFLFQVSSGLGAAPALPPLAFHRVGSRPSLRRSESRISDACQDGEQRDFNKSEHDIEGEKG
jgi:hypothetical protein